MAPSTPPPLLMPLVGRYAGAALVQTSSKAGLPLFSTRTPSLPPQTSVAWAVGAPLIQTTRVKTGKPACKPSSIVATTAKNDETLEITTPVVPRVIKPRKRRKKDRNKGTTTTMSTAATPPPAPPPPPPRLCQCDGCESGNSADDVLHFALPTPPPSPTPEQWRGESNTDVLLPFDDQLLRPPSPGLVTSSVDETPPKLPPPSSKVTRRLHVSSEIVSSPLGGHRDIEIRFFLQQATS